MEVVDLRARWTVRCGADGWLATGGPRPAKAKVIAVTLAIPAAVGAWDETANRPAHRPFCKSALHCFWIPTSTALRPRLVPSRNFFGTM